MNEIQIVACIIGAVIAVAALVLAIVVWGSRLEDKEINK